MEKDIDKKATKISFKISGINSQIANAIRRTLITSIKSYAIDYVSVTHNDTQYADELICHRLGLIPLYQNSMKTGDNKIYLCEEGPKIIYSRDIKFPSWCNSVYEDIIIIKLNDGEKIKLEGVIEEGTGETHAKFLTVCGKTAYEQLSEDTFNFSIETNGSYSAEDIFLESLNILINNLKEIKKIK